MISYNLEPLETYWNEFVYLLEMYHAPEVAPFQGKMTVNLLKEFYETVESQERLHSLIVRDSKELIGYHISVIVPSIHFTTLDKLHRILTAQVIQYFVKKEYRNKSIGSKMFKEAEKSLKTLEVELLISEAKVNLNFDKLFKHLQWEEMATSYGKWI